MSTSDFENKYIIKKSNFFRELQIWPLNEVLDYRGWINNFKNPDELDTACQILDFFIFYPRSMVNKMLRKVIGQVGYVFDSHYSDWEYEDFKKKCIYSFIPGETSNPTDSGHTYVRKLRNYLEIPEDRIYYNDDLYSILENKTNLPVVFVDDFVGSGAQCDYAWNDKIAGLHNRTLKEIAFLYKHKFVYAPLVVNEIGFNRIKQKCIGLELVTNHILDEKYNLFHPDCLCWKNDINLYNKGVALLINKSRELNIPFTNGVSVKDVRGFGEQGLAIAFDDDGVPDAIPPIFYWCTDEWTPLIKKAYQR